MRRLTVALVLSVGTILFVLASIATGAPARSKPRLQIYKLETNTDGHHEKIVKPGATVKSCESDPLYAITYFYRWSGMKEPGKERLLISGPGGFKDDTGTVPLFESHGNNADLATAEQIKAGSEALPAGHYRFRATLDGISRSAALTVLSAGC